MNRTTGIIVVVALALSIAACAGNAKKAKEAQDRADTHIRLGIGYMQQGKKDLALTNLDKAVSVAPQYASAHNAIAILYAQLGEFEQADRHYRKAVELDPKDANARNNYGAFLCDQRRYQEAYAQFEEAVKNPMYKTPELAMENAGLCAMREQNYTYAGQSFRKALETNPNLPVSLQQMAELSFRQKEYLKGRAYIQRMEAATKHNPMTLWLAIKIEEGLQAKDRATEYARQLKAQFPESEQAKSLSGY
ncbi:MAG: type IV pilus biogenesis/stability protein PilW [Pseudomonadota bacterium]